jgi:hypothetical protein
MRIRILCAALALSVAAGSALADSLVWDGVAQVPAVVEGPGQYLVCPAGTHFDVSRGAVDKSACSKGTFAFDVVGASKTMSVQQALDEHLTAPEGMHAVAVGALPVAGEDAWVNIAYKLMKQPAAR